MSSVLRFRKGKAAPPPADSLASEAVGGMPLPPEPALLDWAALAPPVSDSHLAPCPSCGSPNGLSAASCWNCEASLLLVEPFRHRRPPRPAVLASAQPPAHAGASIPVLASVVEDDEATREHSVQTAVALTTAEAAPAMVAPPAPAPTPAPTLAPATVARGRRRTWEIGASVLVVAVVAAGGFLQFNQPAPTRPAPTSPPATTSTTTVTPTVTPTLKAGGGVEAPPPAAAIPPAPSETRTAALRALAVETDPTAPARVPEPSPTIAAVRTPDLEAPARTATLDVAPAPPPKSARAGRARGTARSSHSAAGLAPQPKYDAPDFPRQAPAPATPCSQTVAALGLCALPPNSSKERP